MDATRSSCSILLFAFAALLGQILPVTLVARLVSVFGSGRPVTSQATGDPETSFAAGDAAPGPTRHGFAIGKGMPMLREISHMPAGTLGFEAVGEVDDDDVEKVLAPALRGWMAQRGKIRLLYVLGPPMEEFEGDAVSENAKFLARHPTAFERVAVVSDEEWLRPAIKALSLFLPGEAKAFPVRQLTAAKTWLAEGLDANGLGIRS